MKYVINKIPINMKNYNNRRQLRYMNVETIFVSNIFKKNILQPQHKYVELRSPVEKYQIQTLQLLI
jgi:hypothetical protein